MFKTLIGSLNPSMIWSRYSQSGTRLLESSHRRRSRGSKSLSDLRMKEENTFEQKSAEVREFTNAKRLQIDMFEQAIPPEMKKLDFLKSRVQVSWSCKLPTCSGHRMQVLDWGLCGLQRRDGDVKALERMRELCRLDVYNLGSFLETCSYTRRAS